MGLTEIGCEAVAWVQLVQDRDSWWRLVNTLMSVCILERQEIP
jgi:hypothetical protein